MDATDLKLNESEQQMFGQLFTLYSVHDSANSPAVSQSVAKQLLNASHLEQKILDQVLNATHNLFQRYQSMILIDWFLSLIDRLLSYSDNGTVGLLASADSDPQPVLRDAEVGRRRTIRSSAKRRHIEYKRYDNTFASIVANSRGHN